MRRGDFQRRGDARGSGRGGRDEETADAREEAWVEWRARDGSGSEKGAETVETSARARFRELRLTDAHGALADGGF